MRAHGKVYQFAVMKENVHRSTLFWPAPGLFFQ